MSHDSILVRPDELLIGMSLTLLRLGSSVLSCLIEIDFKIMDYMGLTIRSIHHSKYYIHYLKVRNDG